MTVNLLKLQGSYWHLWNLGAEEKHDPVVFPNRMLSDETLYDFPRELLFDIKNQEPYKLR